MQHHLDLVRAALAALADVQRVRIRVSSADEGDERFLEFTTSRESQASGPSQRAVSVPAAQADATPQGTSPMLVVPAAMHGRWPARAEGLANSPAMAAVLEVLEGADKPLSAAELAVRTGYCRQYIKDLTPLLVAAGRVVKGPNGRGFSLPGRQPVTPPGE